MKTLGEKLSRINACQRACEGIENPEAIKEVIEAARRISKDFIANEERHCEPLSALDAALAKLEATG